MRFSYRGYSADPSPADQKGEVWRPALLVRVIGEAGAPGFPLRGTLDTGAALCVLPYEVAEFVRPTWIGGEGILADYTGETHSVEYGKVDLQIRLETQRVRWFAVVAFDRAREGTALWGMAHFLLHFRVTFHGPDKHFTIRLREPVPAGFQVEPLPGRKGRKRRARGAIPPIPWHEQDP